MAKKPKPEPTERPDTVIHTGAPPRPEGQHDEDHDHEVPGEHAER